MKVFRSILGAAAIALLVPAVASADIIRFDQVNNGGTLTGDDITGYVGTDIQFEFITFQPEGSIVVTNKVFCGAVVDVTGATTDSDCLLNFDTTTGDFTVTAEAGLFTVGGVPIAGTTGLILEGTFTSSGTDVTGLIFTATGFDSKNEALLRFFGVPVGTNFTFASTEIRLENGVVTQADITNTSSVPEPGLLALFGLGLVGAGRLARRRRS